MINRHTKNKLKTAGYFIKRLRDSGFETVRTFNGYSDSDPRKWTVLVDPGQSSVFITCYENSSFKGEYMFAFEDGNRFFRNNYSLKTHSIEIVVNKLLESGVNQIKTPRNTINSKDE
jgi:hypothetical protein